MEQFYGNLIRDVKNRPTFCGIIYCMYWLRSGQIVPLYIGKTERWGTAGSLSANLNFKRGGPFGRWGYGNYWHMGKLGAGLRGDGTHRDWIERLFGSSANRQLRKKTFFAAKPWTHFDRCPCGLRVNVAALEACLIQNARKYFPHDNLNKGRGNPNCRCP